MMLCVHALFTIFIVSRVEVILTKAVQEADKRYIPILFGCIAIILLCVIHFCCMIPLVSLLHVIFLYRGVKRKLNLELVRANTVFNVIVAS